MENEDHIRILLIKELSGTISPEEQQTLDDSLAGSAKARALRNEIRNAEPYNVQSAFPAQQLEADYLEVLQRNHLRKTRRIWNRRIVAGLAAGALLTAYLNWPRDPAPVPPPTVIPTEIQDVTLQFANGETVTFMDGNSQNHPAQSAGLQFAQGTLHFESTTPGWNSVSVPPGKQSVVRLGDGTEVMINSASKIQFRFGSSSREVYLEGEAYFKIPDGSNAPFVIHAGQADLRSMSGNYNVNAYTPTKVAVQVVYGKIEMQSNDKRIVLSSGEEATASTAMPLVPSKMVTQYSLSWTTGEQQFMDMPAAELKEVIARRFNTVLYINSPEAEKKLLKGTIFHNQTLSEFVDSMNAQNEVELYWKNGMLHCN